MSSMSGTEIERLLSLLEDGRNRSREEVVRYVQEHRDEIMADLEQKGEAVIPSSDGENIVLRAA
jgi:hypothetical protein